MNTSEGRAPSVAPDLRGVAFRGSGHPIAGIEAGDPLALTTPLAAARPVPAPDRARAVQWHLLMLAVGALTALLFVLGTGGMW